MDRVQVARDHTGPAYRADVDGLRGLSIIAVVGFHAFPGAVPGGFVGVDVFFVISGYLISQIIAGGLAKGTFSFGEFYLRRINRLFPALIVVLAACFLLGWFVLLSPELEQLGAHLAASAAFAANFMLWHESGYFDNVAATKPFLHLWSLGIEEQFYLLWPLVMVVAWRARLRLVSVALVILALSFAANLAYVAANDRAGDFYSPLSRSWELMIGAILASAGASHLSARANDAVSLGGLALIIVSIFIFKPGLHYPDWRALLPTIGTALVIFAGANAALNRLVLSRPILVFVGLISYPLYLWHWPLLSIATILDGALPPLQVRAVAVVLGLVLAVATYQLVEKPLRRRKEFPALRLKGAALGGAMVLLAGVGIVTAVSGGFTWRGANSPSVANVGDIGHEPFFRYLVANFHKCTPEAIWREGMPFGEARRCFQSKPGERKDVAIIGDSHAEDLFVGLAEQLADRNLVYYAFAQPTLANPQFRRVFDFVSKDRTLDTVILAGGWLTLVRNKNVRDIADLEQQLQETIEFLLAAGKTVYLVEDHVDFQTWSNPCKFETARAPWAASKAQCTKSVDYAREQQAPYVAMTDRLARKLPAITILKAGTPFCDDKLCHMAKDGVLFFRDAEHLTPEGSRYLGRRWAVDYPVLVRPAGR